MNILLPALLSVLALAACSTPSVPPAPGHATGDDLPAAWPRCPSLESSWGKARGPSVKVTGQQAITYVRSGERHCHVSIVYEGKTPRFREIRDFTGKRASTGKLTIMGQQVDFYDSGNEDPGISTQPVQLPTPGGETAWYSFDFSCKEHLKGKNLPVFTW